ncbi:MAG TPA: bifunctional 4-hydroxy-3-methylbut-2-enyl diphosphate reductase/30S ribosomal protein S1 [Clostridiaceae bacterium]
MKVFLAANAGFCFGVKRAVDISIKTREIHGKDIYTLGPLIHNKDVVEFLKDKGIFAIEINEVDKLNENDIIIIRSHGISPEVLEHLIAHKLKIIDATCPYVTNIQLKVKKYYELGYQIIIVGDKEHPEVVGINGFCQNKAIIAKSGEDIGSLTQRVCVVSQTTEKESNFISVLEAVIRVCKEICSFNTICTATKVRQFAAENISKKVDMMLVIGGKNSSNTSKLYEICKTNCKNTFHIENAGEIPINLLNNIQNIGVTAGASTPEWIIKETIKKMDNNEEVEMNEQLAFMDKNSNKIAVGDVLKGEIVSLNDKEAFVNINYKADGLLPIGEVAYNDEESLNDIFKIGDVVQVKVISRKNEDGYVVLSRKELEREGTLDIIKDAFEKKEILNVTVKENVKGGLVASYKGVRIFIPASHLELFRVDNLNDYMGKELDINIIEFVQDRRSTKIVGSRRDILKEEHAEVENAAIVNLEIGQIVEGKVMRLTSFGAFVNILGIDGLLHVSEISWGRVNKPSEVLTEGDIIKVYVLEVDKEKKKISLSIKKLQEDPWNNVIDKYPVDTVVLGKVVRFANFGAFIELEPGVDALVHISQISHKHINKPSEVLVIGQMVKAKILEVNNETKKIALSIKEVEEV